VKIGLNLILSAVGSPEQRDGNEAQHNSDQQTNLYSFDKKANGKPQQNRDHSRYISPGNVCLLIFIH
jgi:hypothetical protein